MHIKMKIFKSMDKDFQRLKIKYQVYILTQSKIPSFENIKKYFLDYFINFLILYN